MTISTKRNTVTFIVRIWAEYLNESPPRWRGVIEPVDGSEKSHFTDLNQIAELIQQNTQDPIKKENES